ncbi:MAG: hypothetical protein ACFE9S_02650 [Candidatus Hermodarchaeota archaeon]
MSFKTIGKEIKIAKIKIPFSEFGETKRTPDLYEGTEKIPFSDRDPQYKKILKDEFAQGDLFEIYQHLIKINYILTKMSE